MFGGNQIECSISTVTAGSPDTFTLASVTGVPQYTSYLGVSGVRMVRYTAVQYTDGNRTTVSKAQGGIGSLDLSTNILTQTKIQWTNDNGTVDDVDPAELLFTAGATTTRVFCSPLFDAGAPTCPFTLGANVATPNIVDTGDFPAVTLSANVVYYTPFWWTWDFGVNLASLFVTVAVAGNARFGLYDIGSDGFAKNLIADFGTVSVNTTTMQGNAPASWTSPTAKMRLPVGWYYSAIVSDVAAQLAGITTSISSPLGMSSRRNARHRTRVMTYGALAADAANNGTGSYTLVNNAISPTIYLGP